jgi:hypothetical protein
VSADVERRAASPATLKVFSVFWAFAALFHLLDAAQFAGLFTNPKPSDIIEAVVAGSALLILANPGRLGALTVLAVATPISAWIEAPVLGNHWLLEAFVDLALLVALIYARRGWSFDRERLGQVFFPAARFILLAFYCFAAFSKLNSAFVNSQVSCANFFAAETVNSLGLPSQWLQGSGLLASIFPYLVIATECSIPILLMIRRTRHFGVAFAVGFHSLVALDLTHPFSDFSSALIPLFLLFLPGDFWVKVQERVVHENPWVRRLLSVLMVGTALGLVLCLWDYSAFGQTVILNGRLPYWILFDVVVLVLLGWYLIFKHDPPQPVLGLPPRAKCALVVPALVVANGLTPYLEIKTSYSWNMYSNLVTAGGSSNHFLIRATAHVTGFQDQLVKIVSSNDPNLQIYADASYYIPVLQLQTYLSNHQDDSLVYSVDGVRHDLARAGDDPALVTAPPWWESRFFAFRALDETSPDRCQPGFLPLN